MLFTDIVLQLKCLQIAPINCYSLFMIIFTHYFMSSFFLLTTMVYCHYPSQAETFLFTNFLSFFTHAHFPP